MDWLLIGEVDVSPHDGVVYLIDANDTALINRLDGRPSEVLPTDENTDEDEYEGRSRAADACARHAGLTPGNHVFHEW